LCLKVNEAEAKGQRIFSEFDKILRSRREAAVPRTRGQPKVFPLAFVVEILSSAGTKPHWQAFKAEGL